MASGLRGFFAELVQALRLVEAGAVEGTVEEAIGALA